MERWRKLEYLNLRIEKAAKKSIKRASKWNHKTMTAYLLGLHYEREEARKKYMESGVSVARAEPVELCTEMPAEQYQEILAAAHGRGLSLGEYIWQAHELADGGYRKISARVRDDLLAELSALARTIPERFEKLAGPEVEK